MIEFDDLHFTECLLGAPTLVGDDLVVPIAQLYAVGGRAPRGDQPLSGRMVFRNAQVSRRKVIEYIGPSTSPSGFKAPYIVEDLDHPADQEAQRFEFEGVQLEPEAWVTWTVRARIFEFEAD